MNLEIGSFKVKDIVFGDKTAYCGGILTVDKEEALRVVREDSHITEAELLIVRPGMWSELCPVKESVEFRCKVSGGTGAYPGATSPLAQAGMGRTHVLSGVTLLSVGKHWGGFQDGLIDMGGPYQHHTIWGDMVNLVLVADTDELFEQENSRRRTTPSDGPHCALREHIAQCVRSMERKCLMFMTFPQFDAVSRQISPRRSLCAPAPDTDGSFGL